MERYRNDTSSIPKRALASSVNMLTEIFARSMLNEQTASIGDIGKVQILWASMLIHEPNVATWLIQCSMTWRPVGTGGYPAVLQ